MTPKGRRAVQSMLALLMCGALGWVVLTVALYLLTN